MNRGSLRARALAAFSTVVAVGLFSTGVAIAAAAPPAPTAVTPSLLQAGATAVAVHVDGSGFVDGATLTDPANDVTFSQVTVSGDTGIDAAADVPMSPSVYGPHTVVVTNPDGSTGQCIRCVTVARVPLAPTSVNITPLDHTLGVSWSEPPSGTPVTYSVRWDNQAGSTGSTHVSSPAFSLQIHGLVPGDVYTVWVSATNTLGTGPETAGQGRPAAVPDKPMIQSTRLGDRSISVYPLTPNDYGRPIVYWSATATPVSGGPSITYVNPPDQAVQFLQLNAGTAYDVVVSARNSIGMSAPSDPVRLTAVAVPGVPRDVWYSFADGRAVFHWLPPASDGGRPIEGYDIWFGPAGPDAPTHYAVTGTSFSVGVTPGSSFNFGVAARNEIGVGVQGIPRWSGVAGYARITALNAGHHAVWRRTDAAGWHALGGTFVSPPSVVRTSSGRDFYVGAAANGRLSLWSASTSWRRILGVRCFQPALREDYRSIVVGCRSTRGTLLVGTADISRGAPVFDPQNWIDTGHHIVGAPAAIEAGFVARTKAWDDSGHNVQYYTYTGWRRVRLACDRDPVADSTATFVACARVGRISWRFLDGYGRPESIAPPVRPVGVMGAAFWGSGAVSFTGADGHLWLLDAGQRRWRRLGAGPASGVRMATLLRGVS